MFLAATAATFARNVVHRGFLAIFQFLLGLATFFNALSRPLTVCGKGRGGSQVIDSRRFKGAVRFGPLGPRSITDASTLPRGPSRSDGVAGVSHVLIKDCDLSRSLNTLCGWNLVTGQLWSAFEHILPPNQFKRRFWWIILHLRSQGICWNYFQLLNYNLFM